MYQHCPVLVPLGVVALAACVTVGAQERTVAETVNLEPGGTLTVESTLGSLQLTSWDQSVVEIHARIEPPPGVDADYAQQVVDGTRIEIDRDGRSVSIRTDYSDVPRRWPFHRRLPHVHYEIQAPRELNLDLEIDRNEATVVGFEGEILMHVDRSELSAEDLAGTVAWDVDRSALSMGNLTGQISLTVDRGRDVVLDGVTGSFALDLDRTDVTMRNVVMEGDSSVDIDRGDLAFDLDPNQALTIDADLSRRADFSSDLPVTREESGRHVKGTIHGGGPRLEIEADRATIRLRTR